MAKTEKMEVDLQKIFDAQDEVFKMKGTFERVRQAMASPAFPLIMKKFGGGLATAIGLTTISYIVKFVMSGELDSIIDIPPTKK